MAATVTPGSLTPAASAVHAKAGTVRPRTLADRASIAQAKAGISRYRLPVWTRNAGWSSTTRLTAVAIGSPSAGRAKRRNTTSPTAATRKCNRCKTTNRAASLVTTHSTAAVTSVTIDDPCIVGPPAW